MLRTKPILLILLLSLIGCQGDVLNNEPVFDTFKPDSKEYKDKLAEKINDHPDDVVYYLKNYHLIDHNEYLEFDVQGTDFKAIGFVLVKDWKKMSLIRKNKANGYAGAEFSLKLDVEQNPNGAILVYKDLNYIID